MISMYTDVSCRKGKAVATCFVTTTKNFIGCRTFEYENVCSTIQGELFGIRDGLKYLETCVDVIADDAVEVFCDSEAALGQINGTAKDKLFKSTVSTIRNSLPNNDVVFKFVQGHQIERNPNKVVDKVSNSVLRYRYPNKRKRKVGGSDADA